MRTIKINERYKLGRSILDLLESFAKDNKKVVEILEPTKKENQPEFLEDLNLTKKEKAFYKKFGKSIEELRAMEAGKLKARPLKEVLDEI